MILLVEDDLELASLVVSRLEREGYEVAHVTDGAVARDTILSTSPDVVLLDVMLPSLDGFAVCRAVRASYRGVIVMLTARDEDADEVLGLELGADDYLVKPVRPRVLVARIRAHLRRAAAPIQSDQLHTHGHLRVDAQRREVHLAGVRVPLTTTEFDVLHYLVARAGEVVSREALYDDVFGSSWDGMDRAADVYVSRLRQKLGDDPKAPEYLKTVRGAGYLFAPASP
jgi:two-component system OmpR family response regulator/two-component system response regulator RstA